VPVPLTTTYHYDARNRLARVDLPDGTVASYAYDPFGRRVKKQVGSAITLFVYADEGLVGEYDGAGMMRKLYGWKPDGLWGTDPLYMVEGGNYYFYQNDHLGTPQRLTSAADGSMVWSAGYLAFGSVVVDPLSTVENNLRFPGQYADAETGLHFNWNRYYEPDSGRYAQTDPIGFVGGVNYYSYSTSNPINLMDILGLFTNKAGLENLLGRCEFYDALYNNYIELNGCSSLNASNYFIAYGKKYCERFNTWTFDKLSKNGQGWIKATTIALQRAILTIENINELGPEEIAEKAFRSHVDSYMDSGLGELPLSDLVYVGLTPDIAELKGPYSDETIQQAGAVFERIRQSDTYDRLVDEVVEYGSVPFIYGTISAGFEKALEVK
jgi:RHS repeat-associated protein